MEDYQKKMMLALLAYLTQRGVDINRVCNLSGISLATLQTNSRQPVTAAQLNSFWQNAAHLAGDPLLGLHFGESMQLAALGAIGQIVLTSASVGDALSHACTFTTLLTDLVRLSVETDKQYFRIVFSPNASAASKYPHSYRQMLDFLMVFTIHELNGLVLQKISPVKVLLPYTPEEMGEYTRIFGMFTSRKVQEASITFSRSLLDLQILSANYELQNHLLKQMPSMLKDGDADGTLHKKVYHYLLSNSYLYVASLEAVAANFTMSTRSLQRRLKEEGISFQEIADSVKMILAKNYLDSGNHSIKDIAFALGYNEQTAFVRAFKRWTGTTPVAYQSSQNTSITK